MAKCIAVFLFLFGFSVGLLPQDNLQVTESSSSEVIPSLASITTGAHLAVEPKCTNPPLNLGCLLGLKDNCCPGFVCQKSISLPNLNQCEVCVGEDSKCDDKPCCKEYYCSRSTDSTCKKCITINGDCSRNSEACCPGTECTVDRFIFHRRICGRVIHLQIGKINNF